MAAGIPGESYFEVATIERLTLLGYEHDHGAELRERPDFPREAVVLVDELRRHLRARSPYLPDDAIETAMRIAANPEGVSVLQRNMNFHRLLVRGFEVKYTPSPRPLRPTGEGAAAVERYEHVYLINWDEPEKNDFRVVSQLPIRGHNDRRPDLIFFVAARSLVGDVKHAESVEELRTLLQTEGGEVIFTTIEKFRLREEETRHPILSERRNIIVIADEAHRTQYGLLDGFAYHLRRPLRRIHQTSPRLAPHGR